MQVFNHILYVDSNGEFVQSNRSSCKVSTSLTVKSHVDLAAKSVSHCYARGSSRLHVVLSGQSDIFDPKFYYGGSVGRLVDHLLFIVHDNCTWLEYTLALSPFCIDSILVIII